LHGRMVMATAVLIPWRTSSCPHRKRAFAWVLARLAVHGWPVIVGRHDDGPWCKAAAVADALDQTAADVLVLHDADVWSDGLAGAVRTVQAGAAWAMAHRSVHRLSEAATERLIAGEDPSGLDLSERAYRGVAGGGTTVVCRYAYERCPLDPRFVGWGSEDEAWGWALTALYEPPWRPAGHAPLTHLWHPEPQRATRARGSLANWDLRKRYARAQHDPAAMRALIEEAKTCELAGLAEPVGDDRQAVRGR
jgi:hypothetical protein